MVVEFSKGFIKELKKHSSKSEAKTTIEKLSNTSPAEGNFITIISNIVIREKKLKTFRFYFIVDQEKKHILSKDELKDFLIKFVALSKKNNQQEIIDKLKEDLKKFSFKMH